MSDTKNTGDKPLTVGKTLSLKRPVEAGVVRQSFSHGRTKAVVVETVKRRTIGPGTAAPAKAAPAAAAPAAEAKAATPAAPVAPKAKVAAPAAPAAPVVETKAPAKEKRPSPNAGKPASGVVLRTLSDEERDARARALAAEILEHGLQLLQLLLLQVRLHSQRTHL